MKKTYLALLLTGALALTAVGCTDDKAEKETTTNQQTTTTEDKTAEKQENTQDATAQTEPDPTSQEPSHKEISDAFALSGYRVISPANLAGIAMGKIETPLNEQERLALAKAITKGMADAEWHQGDLPPGIFLSEDGTAFGIGLKRPNGDLEFTHYANSGDGNYTAGEKQIKKSA